MLKSFASFIVLNPTYKNLFTQSLPAYNTEYVRHLHITSAKLIKVRSKDSVISVKSRTVDDGTDGANTININLQDTTQQIFPDENTPNVLFNGIPYKDLPITNINATPNNTIMSLTNAAGQVIAIHSCGREGFKNIKKSTNIAAQQTAVSLGTKMRKMGYNTVRVSIRGIGPGRMSALKGLQMSGVDIVSITDCTRITPNPLRPPKPRKL